MKKRIPTKLKNALESELKTAGEKPASRRMFANILLGLLKEQNLCIVDGKDFGFEEEKTE